MPRTDYATKFAKHKNIKRESGGWFLYRPNGYRECLVSIPGVWDGTEDEDSEVIDLTIPLTSATGEVEDIIKSETVPDALVEEEPVETPEEVVQEDVKIDYNSMTKGEFSEFALKEYDITLSINNNKKTMIEKFEMAMDKKD